MATSLPEEAPPGAVETRPDDAVRMAARSVETVRELRLRVEQLQGALDSRVVIEQAKGVLAERYAVGVDEAFEALRRGARRDGRKIHALAREVVSSRTTPPSIVASLSPR